MKKLFAIVATVATTVVPVWSAPPSTPPLPQSAVLFTGDYSFSTVGTTYSAPVSAPVDGAWLTGTGVWNHRSFPYWDCSHSYTGTLVPDSNDYSPLFIAGWTPQGICSNQPPIFGCLNCGVDWGGVKAYPGFSMTTDNTPGFLAAGTGTIVLRSNNSGGSNDLLTLRVEQVNRDAMVNMTIYQSVDEENPAPLSASELAARYFIANSADRVPVVPVFHYGTDSTGADRQYPAGPGITWSATWDSGATTTPEEAVASQGLHGHSILAVPIPKLPTGKHTFTVKATLPSGKTYTSDPMEVFIYAQNIYVTVEGNFAPKNPIDQAPQFVPGSSLNGASLDLSAAPQIVQLNILVGRGSTGTFDVKLTNGSRYPGIAMNYPADATDTDPDIDFGSGDTELFSVPIPKGGAPKVVKLPLYIHDYAGSATIEVKMPYRKTTFIAKRRIPLDANANGLPDRPYTAIGGVEIDTANLTATGDVDAAGGAAGSEANVTGDGLSNFEEFRGFFVAGGYVRLDPREKDIFVDVDPAFLLSGPVSSPVTLLGTIGPRILYLEPNESRGTDQLSRNLLRTRAVVATNRATVPVAHTSPQRAVRLIQQTAFPPAVHLAGPNIDVPVWQVGFLGATIGEEVLNIDLLNAPGNVATLETPMRTQFSEVYTRTFTNLAVNTTFSYPEHYDAAGNVVPRCTSPGQANCDFWDTDHNLIIPSLQEGGWGILYTVPDPAHDPVEHYSLQARSCLTDDPILGGLTTIQMERLKGLIAAHEMGHAMHMDHLRDYPADCSAMMFDTEAPPPNRRAMSNFVPQPTGFTTSDRAMIRLWNP